MPLDFVQAAAGTLDLGDPAGFHRTLARFNQTRLAPQRPHDGWEDDLLAETRLRLAEGAFVETERAAISARAATAPTDPDGFVAWFEDLRETGPGQNDPLFPWLAERASREEMRWFLTQEMAGEAGFDDLVALTQVKFPTQAKLELARNYWDEMGRGTEAGMHGPMLERIGRELGLKPTIDETVWEALALANMMVALATSRRYAYHAAGALGAVELTAPTRVGLVDRGLARLRVPRKARHYFGIHAVLDKKHSEAWDREVLRSLVAADPATARPLAEGALLRLACGARCFDRYRREFGL